MAGQTLLCTAVGPELAVFEVDAATATLEPRGSARLPAAVQYAWPHPHLPLLYVASSDRMVGQPGRVHTLTALRWDAARAVLVPHGPAAQLPTRPIHLAADKAGECLLTACNDPSLLLVHRLDPDGSIGQLVEHHAPLDFGHYAHQVRSVPGGAQVILTTRGNDPTASRPEDPGALKLFDLTDGVLTSAQSVAPDGGYGFGPRHLDFHPSQPWVFVSVERQNQMQVFKLERGRLSDRPLFTRSTLSGDITPRQWAGAVHCHPNGRHVYVANRSDWVADVDGQETQLGGENSLAVFDIDPLTGTPALVQSVDARGCHVRCFAIDPGGSLLVAASTRPRQVRNAGGSQTLPAGLSLFRVGADVRLDYIRRQAIEVGSASLFWIGMMRLA